MGTQHRAPLAAFVLVTMVAGGVAAQSLHGGDRVRVEDTVAASSTASPQVPREVAPQPPGSAPSTSRPSAAAAPGLDVPSAGELPSDRPSALPAGLIDAIPGLAGFLEGSGGGGEPSFEPVEDDPTIDLGSTAEPSPGPSPAPSPSGTPSPTGTPSGSPSGSPSSTPGGSPSTTPSADAERPAGATPTPTNGPTAAPAP
ncbi:hypothetical protein QWY28_07055 [Nocardioides sp. SOB77]|uniref:Uncharacterized protein n=1 Tax=Nocardioides oceani TaxID=3058369 RepID=A0ABT8FDN4_9ACTN|nr:hypothetical protein [Nocardioides oceani]MDN4172691.1 hypothetical protein [Nocardioides oceani]